MPTNLQEWMWFLIVTVAVVTVILGTVVSVVANFITISLRDWIESRGEEKRRKAREKDAEEEERFEKDVERLFLHPFFVADHFAKIELYSRSYNRWFLMGAVFGASSILLYGIWILTAPDALLSSGFSDIFLIKSSFTLFVIVALWSAFAYSILSAQRMVRKAIRAVDIRNEYSRRLVQEITREEEEE